MLKVLFCHDLDLDVEEPILTTDKSNNWEIPVMDVRAALLAKVVQTNSDITEGSNAWQMMNF